MAVPGGTRCFSARLAAAGAVPSMEKSRLFPAAMLACLAMSIYGKTMAGAVAGLLSMFPMLGSSHQHTCWARSGTTSSRRTGSEQTARAALPLECKPPPPPRQATTSRSKGPDAPALSSVRRNAPELSSFVRRMQGCAARGHWDRLEDWFRQVVEAGLMLDDASFHDVLKYISKSAGPDGLDALRSWISHMQNHGVFFTRSVYTTIVQGFSRHKQMDEVEQWFRKCLADGWAADVPLVTAVMRGHYYRGEDGPLLRWLDWLEAEGLQPDKGACRLGLRVCAQKGGVWRAEELLEKMPSWGLEPELHDYNLVLSACCTSKDAVAAHFWLDELESRWGDRVPEDSYRNLLQACLVNRTENMQYIDSALTKIHQRRVPIEVTLYSRALYYLRIYGGLDNPKSDSKWRELRSQLVLKSGNRRIQKIRRWKSGMVWSVAKQNFDRAGWQKINPRTWLRQILPKSKAMRRMLIAPGNEGQNKTGKLHRVGRSWMMRR